MLFRDHLGIKPLHYAHHDGALLFASSTSALAAVIPPRLDRAALDAYLATGYVRGPGTLLRGIRDVPAGSMAVFSFPGAAARIVRWFSLEGRQIPTRPVREEIEACVRSEASMRGRLFTTLSGGIDSTLVASLARRVDPEVTAITVSYPDLPDDADLPAAVRVAADLGIRLEHVRVGADEYAAALRAGWRFDQPLADPNAIAFALASRRVMELGGCVLLGGDGADELFCGYPYYRRGARPRVGRVAAATFTSMSDAHDRAFARRITRRPSRRPWRVPLGDPVRIMQWEDLTGWLEANVLEKADRFGMAHGVEVRVPFLRQSIVRTALALAGAEKARGWDGAGKILLREAFADVLPPYVAARPKTGFACPMAAWLRGPLGS